MPRSKWPLAAIVGVILLVWPAHAHAYVDPGVLAVLTQGFYVLIMVGAAFILRPWRYFKSLFGKRQGNAAPADADEPRHAAEDHPPSDSQD